MRGLVDVYAFFRTGEEQSKRKEKREKEEEEKGIGNARACWHSLTCPDD
jgi:hypothetical protein